MSELRQVVATDWIDGIEMCRFSQQWRERHGSPAIDERTLYMEILESHDITWQHKIGQDSGRFIMPMDTPEHVVALALALIDCDIERVEQCLT